MLPLHGGRPAGRPKDDPRNAAIRNHIRDARALRVFEGASGEVKYLGEFGLDSAEPCYRADAPETNDGPMREVIIFRLRPKAIEPAASNPKLEEIFNQPDSARIPLERLLTERFYVAPSAKTNEADRREQALVRAFEAHLKDLGTRFGGISFGHAERGGRYSPICSTEPLAL